MKVKLGEVEEQIQYMQDILDADFKNMTEEDADEAYEDWVNQVNFVLKVMKDVKGMVDKDYASRENG